MSSRIAVIINGRKKLRPPLQSFMDHLARSNELDIRTTEYPGHATRLTHEAIAQHSKKIICIGGDGTLNEVINGIVTSSDPEIPCLSLANGTANDWGKTWEAPSSVAEMIKRIDAVPASLDIGEIGYSDSGNRKLRYFLNIADTGMGADVVLRVNRSRRRFSSNLIFMKSIISSFFSFKNGEAACYADGKLIYSGRIRMAVIANGRYFGSGLCIAPDARPDDGKFQLVLIGNVSLMDYLKYLPALRRGKHINHPEVMYMDGKLIELRTPGLSTEADGEFIGSGNVTFRAISGGINLL